MNRRDVIQRGMLGGGALLAAGTALGSTAKAQGNSTFDRIRETGVLRTSVIPAGQEPYFHKNLQSGQWSGTAIDMANDIAKALSARLELVETTWGNSVLDLQAGKIDIAFGLAATPVRALAVDFSAPVFLNSYVIIGKKGMSRIESWSEINKPEIQIGVEIGTTHEMVARRYAPRATLRLFKSRNEAILGVATGRLDCLVDSAILGIKAIKANPDLGILIAPKPTVSLSSAAGIRIDADKRFRDFVNVWVNYNRSLGQVREWLLGGLALAGVEPSDVPAEVQF